ILVTGAGRGIGRALALHFARKGANLALMDTHLEGVDETRAQCAEAGVTARSYVANAADEDSVIGALDGVTTDFGRLDGLVNNAGIVRDALLIKVKDGRVVGKMTAPTPLGRLGEPEEIAHAVGFIFENELFSGRCLEVDGGLRM